jgi:serine phosphatase RsbU (regulator of sigma subunit)
VFNEITNKFKKAQESVLEQEKMQKEMEVAKEIQHSLLPRQTPKVSGYDIAPLYQAAAEVGGDYYDFVDVDDDTIGVVVADVSGKGVPGSLVMTMIRTALRMEARGNKHASDVMSKMNTFVTDEATTRWSCIATRPRRRFSSIPRAFRSVSAFPTKNCSASRLVSRKSNSRKTTCF